MSLNNCHYIGLTISRPELPINVLLIFDMHYLNKALVLMVNVLSLLLLALVSVRLIIPLTTIYASLKSRKSNLNIEVLNFIFLY